jgi:hypothetical protein
MLQSAKNGNHIFSHFPTPDPWRIGWRAAPGWSLRPNTQRYLRRGATWVGASWSHPGEIEAGSYWLDYMTIWAIDNGTYILSQLIKWIYDWIISYSAHYLRRNRWAEWSRCTWIATIHQAEITSFGDSYPNPISIIPVASRHPGSFGVNWSSLEIHGNNWCLGSRWEGRSWTNEISKGGVEMLKTGGWGKGGLLNQGF